MNKLFEFCSKKFWDRYKKNQIFCSRPCANKSIRTTHGMSKAHFYRIWYRIFRVCNKPNHEKYLFYGGRGIKCFWKSFEEFQDDMYESYLEHYKIYGHLNTTIERVNNNGNYCKENCRWATRKEQARNRRNRKVITFNNQTKSITEWAEIKKIPKIALWLRLYRRNWSIEKSLNTPLRKH